MDLARQILAKAAALKKQFILPLDHVVATAINEFAETKVVDNQHFPSDRMGVDIGPRTIDIFKNALVGAKTIVWNGPMGVFEQPAFATGTMEIAKAVADSGAVTIVGGGETVSAVKKAGVTDKISHVSTGGGASLELLEGKVLPGVAALES